MDRIFMMHKNKGFSLIELIVAVMIIAFLMLGVAAVYQTVLHRVVKLKLLTVAIGLAEEKTEATTRLSYDDVANEALTAFSAPFADYSYQVTAVNVNPPDMDTAVVGSTGYKNITVSITHATLGTYSTHIIFTDYE